MDLTHAHKSISRAIEPYKKPFVICEDGRSQTKLSNKGRVGFKIEEILGIPANKSRKPDYHGWEIKATKVGKGFVIGTMTIDEFHAIDNSSCLLFTASDPYQKIKQTALVFYELLERRPDPLYQILGCSMINFASMSKDIKDELQSDYEFICSHVKKCRSRDDVTRNLQRNGTISGEYLKLTYKGQGSGGYNYPAWKLSDKFMKKIYD